MYRIGQIFEESVEKTAFILALVDFRTVVLIELDTGNRWRKPVLVDTDRRIKDTEFEQVIGSGIFTLIAENFREYING